MDQKIENIKIPPKRGGGATGSTIFKNEVKKVTLEKMRTRQSYH
jgi:hypothetical protein